MRRLVVMASVMLLCGSPASAQFLERFEESRWGLQASVTPEWRSADFVRDIFGADRFDLSGSDLGAALLRRTLSHSFIRSYTCRRFLASALWPGTACGRHLQPRLSRPRPA
jgi:hypothetical protein